MPGLPDTRETLLLRVRDPADGEAWRQFTVLYRPVVYRLARKKGLQDADADDLAQQVLISVAGAVDRWQPDPNRGRFRSWLLRIAHNAIVNALTRRPRDAAAGGTSMVERLRQQPDAEDPLSEEIHWEWRRELFRRAAEAIRGEFHEATWEAFWTTTVEGAGIEEAAEQLGKSVGAVYAARSRVMRRLRDAVREIEKAYCEESSEV